MIIIKILKNTIWNKNTKNKKQKILFVFYDMIADMLSNKRLNLIVIEFFIRRRKLNISFVFITQSVPNFCTKKY